MKREITKLAVEGQGFTSVEAAVEWLKRRPAIRYAKIGLKSNGKFMVVVSSFEHWSQYMHWIAEYKMEPSVRMIEEKDQ